MRNLVLLRGSPACGKSYWIKEHGLEQFVLCADDIRLMIQSPILIPSGGEAISQNNDKYVWNLLKDILEQRMNRGEFTIIDATHSRSSFISSNYKKLCDKYRYRCFVVDFSNVPKEMCLERNRVRSIYKIVPEDVIENAYSRMKTQPVPGWTKNILPEEFDEYFPRFLNPLNFDKYERVYVLGDIHGCYEPVKEFFDSHPYSENNFYIFIGDYVDRGIQNKEVLEFLFNFSKNKNVLLLEGNHERWLRYFAEDDAESIRSKEFSIYTVPQIKDIDKKELREFCRRLGQIAWFEFGGNTFYVNHGGTPLPPSVYYSSEEYFKGTGKYEDCLTVENSWNTLVAEKCYQIHGHRNIEKSKIENGRCFNLCDTIEFGGNFRWMEINKDFALSLCGYIKNNVYYIHEQENDAPIPIAVEPMELIEQLKKNKFIYEKKLTDHISSFNFTEKAFYDKVWNEQTQKARGLFVNVSTGEVVARSYEKFFNIGENDSVKTTELRRKLCFPVSAYLKYNGYMGVVGYDSEKDELWIASKTTNQSDFAKGFKDILEKAIDTTILKSVAKEKNVSFVFEVIDAINDPHIIDYGTDQRIILLDIIERVFDYKKWKYDDLWNFGKENGLEVKERCFVFDDYNSFYEFYVSTDKNYDYVYNDRIIEGFVFEDTNGFMTKMKTEYYKVWKFFRGIAHSMYKGRSIDTRIFYMPLQNYIFGYLKSLPKDDLQKSIIELRKMFYRDFKPLTE